MERRILLEGSHLRGVVLAGQRAGQDLVPARSELLLQEGAPVTSTTLNMMLSRFRIAILSAMWRSGQVQQSTESYFSIIGSMAEADELESQVRLFLCIDERGGGYFQRGLRFQHAKASVEPGTTGFLNLDAVWYAVVQTTVDSIGCDQLLYSDAMNGSQTHGQYGGKNPYQGLGEGDSLTLMEYDRTNGVWGRRTLQGVATLNQFLKWQAEDKGRTVTLHSMEENHFRGNPPGERVEGADGKLEWPGILQALDNSTHLLCTSTGIYGVQVLSQDSTGSEIQAEGNSDRIAGFRTILWDLASSIQNLESNDSKDRFEFLFCRFAAISEETTLFISLRTRKLEGEGDFEEKYHTFYLSESSSDVQNGLAQLDFCCVDGQVFEDTASCFRELRDLKSLGTNSILMTDCGFWDIEENQTANVVS